jgi:hypothetical protein
MHLHLVEEIIGQAIRTSNVVVKLGSEGPELGWVGSPVPHMMPIYTSISFAPIDQTICAAVEPVQVVAVVPTCPSNL